MAQSVFPEVTASSSGPNAYAATIPAASTKYKLVQSFLAGAYTITTSPNTSQATVTFYNATSTQTDTTTVSGTVTYNLSTAATGAFVSIDAGTNTVVTITLVANSLPPGTPSGTLDTITATGNYNQTGLLYVLAIGGGGAGSVSINGQNSCGGGGGSGYGTPQIVIANTTTAVTVGAGGASSGATGGTTNFGNLVSAAGGQGGQTNVSQVTAVRSTGGGSGGSGQLQMNGAASPVYAIPLTNGTTGGGGGGGMSNAGGAGAGSGIGTGGNGGNQGTPGNTGTGYGSGGGGSGGNQNTGTAASTAGLGRQGVIYVLRGI